MNRERKIIRPKEKVEAGRLPKDLSATPGHASALRGAWRCGNVVPLGFHRREGCAAHVQTQSLRIGSKSPYFVAGLFFPLLCFDVLTWWWFSWPACWPVAAAAPRPCPSRWRWKKPRMWATPRAHRATPPLRHRMYAPGTDVRSAGSTPPPRRSGSTARRCAATRATSTMRLRAATRSSSANVVTTTARRRHLPTNSSTRRRMWLGRAGRLGLT